MRCKPTCFTCLLIQVRENFSSIIHHSTQSVGWLDASVQHAALGALTDASALRRRRHETQAREVPTHHYNFRTWWKGINSILCLWGTWSTSSSTVSAHIFITDAWIYVFRNVNSSIAEQTFSWFRNYASSFKTGAVNSHMIFVLVYVKKTQQSHSPQLHEPHECFQRAEDQDRQGCSHAAKASIPQVRLSSTSVFYVDLVS